VYGLLIYTTHNMVGNINKKVLEFVSMFEHAPQISNLEITLSEEDWLCP
jgi:hypothetical protein